MEAAAAAERSPWGLGYQLNERYLLWNDSAQRQLILIWVAQQVSEQHVLREAGRARRRAARCGVEAAASVCRRQASFTAVRPSSLNPAPFCWDGHHIDCNRDSSPQLDITLAELEGRVAELALLLPDLAAKLDRLQVSGGGLSAGMSCVHVLKGLGAHWAGPASWAGCQMSGAAGRGAGDAGEAEAQGCPRTR
jgi:hypothetical protein